MMSLSFIIDHITIPIKKNPVTTIDVFQLKILEKCQRINVNWYRYQKIHLICKQLILFGYDL
jgi:hypothetical protein